MVGKNISVELELLLDARLSPTAKFIRQILKTFPPVKIGHLPEKAVIAAHREIASRSGLSQNTVIKTLNSLEKTGWIRRQRNLGSPNTYFLTNPSVSPQSGK